MLRDEQVSMPLSRQAQVVRGGEGSTVVYLHNLFGVTPEDEVARALADEFDVVAPLHPGFAELSELDDIRDVHELAFHYDALLDELGLDQVRLIGHSYGGMVAAELAAHVPSRVSQLVLAAPLGIWRDDEPAPDIFRAYPRRMDSLLWSEQFRPSAAPTAGGNGSAQSGSEDSRLDVLLGMAQGMTAVGKFLWPLPDKGLERRLHRIKAETLVLWGSADNVVPRSYVDVITAKIPNASLTVLEDASHMAPVEAPDDFVARVRAFFGG